MHLIAPLACGLSGAANGTVDVYVRGTTTRAAYYATFEGGTSITPTASIALDSNGGASIYVNQVVDCVVKNSSGTLVRRFTAGISASAVEVRGTYFTGVDYTTGVSSVGNPVDLQTVLDRFAQYAGFTANLAYSPPPDWHVVVNGTSKTLASALSGLSGVFFNVKSSDYGALGDGSTDDTTAIAAAITAASSNGGIVYFPPGTYRVTSTLTLGAKVSLQGAGAGASLIAIDHASNNLLTYSNASTKDPQFIDGLQLYAAQSNSGKLITITATVFLNIINCYIGSSNQTGKCLHAASANAYVRVYGTGFETNTAAHVDTSGGGGALLSGCRFVFPATYNTTSVNISGGALYNCIFYNGTVTAGTFTNVSISGSSAFGGVVSGCAFPNAGGATVTSISGVGSTVVTEVGCIYGTTVNRPTLTVSPSNATHQTSPSLSRNQSRYYVADNSANLEINPNLHGFLEVVRTNNGNQALTLTTPTQSGLDCLILYNNNHGAGGGTITWTGNVQPSAATFAVNANKVTYHWLRSTESALGNLYWAQYGTLANQNP